VNAFPSEWRFHRLSELGFAYSGLSGKSKKDFGTGSNYVPYKNVFFNTFVDLTYVEQVSVPPDEVQNKVQKGDVLLTISSETPEEVGMSAVVANEVTGDLYLNSFCFGFRPTVEGLLPRYLGYAFRSSYMRKKLVFLAQGTTRFNISKGRVLDIELPIPTVGEQHKIAAILTALDDKLDVISRQIEATQTLKQGLMQTLFSRGVGIQDANGRWVPHAEFKDSGLGEIPAAWGISSIGSLFEVVERAVRMADQQSYRRVTVKRRHGGIELRDEQRGSDIKVKSQFALEAGDFLISERQIVHGACGIVPVGLAGALVSNEYLVLKARAAVDVRYFNYLVQQLKYAKYFMLCSQGVDIEKFLFKPKDWLKKQVPVPPISEQARIADVLTTADEKLNALKAKRGELQRVKRGLMQKLLTGEWRVSLDPSATVT